MKILFLILISSTSMASSLRPINPLEESYRKMNYCPPVFFGTFEADYWNKYFLADQGFDTA